MAVSPYRKRGLSCPGILAQVRLCPYPKRARGRVQPGHSQLTLSVALFRGSGGFKGALGQAQAGARRRQSPAPTSKPLKAQPAWEFPVRFTGDARTRSDAQAAGVSPWMAKGHRMFFHKH